MPYATTPAAATTILAAAIPSAAAVRSFEVTTLFNMTLFSIIEWSRVPKTKYDLFKLTADVVTSKLGSVFCKIAIPCQNHLAIIYRVW